MEFLQVVLTAIGSVAALFVLTKLMGKKQMSELSMFDYINGITIGSISAEMATAQGNDFLFPLIAMVVYALMAVLISWVSCKSLTMRRWLTGTPLVLFRNNTLYRKNMMRAKLDLSDLLTQCRINGYFHLADLQEIILEPTGRLSFLPKATKRPACPSDLNLPLPPEPMEVTVILDGQVIEDHLRQAGRNERWLSSQLKLQGISQENRVFLAVTDGQTLTVFPHSDEKIKQSPFA